MRMIQLVSLLVLVLTSSQAFAWQKGYPFPTDLNIPLDDHHSVLIWFQNTPQIEIDFTKHSAMHGNQSSDVFPAQACVASVQTVSSTATLLVEQSVLNLPLPSDVKDDLGLKTATRLMMSMETDTNFSGPAQAHAVELDAIDAKGVVVQVLFQGTIPYDQNGPVAEIQLGQEGKYLSNPALSCK